MMIHDYEVKHEDQGRMLDWLERVADQIREGRIRVTHLNVTPLSGGGPMDEIATMTWVRFADEDGRRARRQRCNKEWRKVHVNG